MNPIHRVPRSFTTAACASAFLVSVCTLDAQTVASGNVESSASIVGAAPHDRSDASIRP